MNALFITGSDTGIGKTFVACAMAHALRARGRRVGVVKAVETGVVDEPEDARRLAEAAADPSPLDDICPYRLRAPLAPAVAAELEGVVIDLGRIEALVRRRATETDFLIVEGAGGLMVPIAGRATFLELARALALPLLIVGADRLGTINHCVLTARVARAAGLRIVGFVLSQTARDRDASAGRNAGPIESLAELSCLGQLPFCATGEPADVVASLELPAVFWR